MFEHRPFGNRLKLVIRGASHAQAIEFTLSGFPCGFRVDAERLQAFLERRAPGRDDLSTQRHEADCVEFVSGLSEGRTTGMPIVGRIANTDSRPHDYGAERTIPRPGHADFGQWVEQGRIPTGGGANSGRLTVALCAAGGLCRQWLARRGVSVSAEIVRIGGRDEGFEETIQSARDDGDSVGGVIRCRISGLPAGLGGALFAGIESELSAALFAIPGVKGVSFGNGFAAADLRGSENDDLFVLEDGRVRTASNNHGGLLGGRTSGEMVVFDVALKPTPTVFTPLSSVDLATMTTAACCMKGRHDPCIVRRAVPVVEAAAAFVLADVLLSKEAELPRICLTLTGRTLTEDLAQLASERLFTDIVEIRVDLLDPSERAQVARFIDTLGMPAIVTFRRASDGGAFAGDEAERVQFFRDLLSALKPDRLDLFVDFESDFRRDDLVSLAREKGATIVRSRHFFDEPAGDVAAVCRALVAGTDEIAKVAFCPRSSAEVRALFAAAGEWGDVPHVVCAMGTLGVSTRTLAARTGSLWSYASVGGLDALGHLTPKTLVRDYRFRVATRQFDLYGVTGWPLRATRSPEIHNAAFAAEDRDAVMAAFPCETARNVIDVVRALGLRGMAVTIPHKESVIPFLDEVTPEAQAIGAVNTIAVSNGRLVGSNTDAAGFSVALLAFLGRKDLVEWRVAVLGAGGAAKAVVHALHHLGADVKSFHRETPPAGFDLLVNATPVDPIPDYVFSGREAVYDLVYVPEETPLLKRARAAGCRGENGFSMLLAQARLQREIWSRS